MLKRCAAALLCLAIVAPAAPATAEMIPMTPTFYNPANDIADWHLNRRDVSDELIQSLRGGSFAANLLPITDDLLLWYGRFEYHNLVQEESFWLSYDVQMPRSDAYAVAVDGEGRRLWSLRLSDPQSENSFSSAWRLEDGRILLKFNDQIGEFGSQFYVVSQAGEVQEMLPAYKAKAYGEAVYEMLMPMHGGFFGGGQGFEGGAYNWMLEGANLTFFNDTLDLQWRNESETYRNGFLQPREATDGILLGGSLWPDYIPDQPYLHQVPQSVPIATKLDLAGNTVWTYVGHPLSIGSAALLYGTDDGGALFVTGYDPAVPTGYNDPERITLVKLDGSGEIQWMKQPDEYPGHSATDLVPYGAGYLICTYSPAENNESDNAVLYIAEDGTLLGAALLDKGTSSATNFHAYTSLVSTPDGGAYLYGNTIESEGMLAGMDNPQMYRPFYVKMEDVFPTR